MGTVGWVGFLVLWFAYFALAIVGDYTHAQDKPTPEPSTPTLSDTMKLQIRDAQLDQAQMVVNLSDTISKYNQLQAALAEQAKKIADLKTAALAELKLDPEKWDFDMQKLVAVPLPPKPPLSEPTGPPVVPAGKKP